MSIFAKNRIGLSATSFAAIMTTQQFLFIFTKTLIGYLADYFNKLKAIIGILTIIPIIFLFLLLAVPKINNYQSVESRNITSLTFSSVANNNESCQLLSESIAPVRTTFSSNMLCSSVYSKHQKFQYKCLRAVTTSLSSTAPDVDTNSKTIVDQLMYMLGENKLMDTSYLVSACALCCNDTENCYIVSCPEHETNFVREPKEISQFKTYQFWEFAIFLTFSHVCLNALFTLSDTACCETVVKTGSDLGKQRLYGAASWGLMSPLGGLLNDYTDDYLPGWTITGLMLALSLWNLWKLDLVQPQFSQNILKDVRTVMSSKEFITFQIGVLMNGIGIGFMWSYQIWFLTTIGASRFLCGLVQTVQCFAGEVPFMFFSGWFIKKIGHSNALSLALLAYCTRFLWYSYLKNPWLVLPMECVHGFTYGIFYPAVASFAKLSSKPGTEATTQSILFSTHEGLGMCPYVLNCIRIA